MKKIEVVFELEVSIGLPDENYSGRLTLLSATAPRRDKTFYFKAFCVHDENNARITIYHDECHKHTFASGTSVPGVDTRQSTTKNPSMEYDFGLRSDDPKMGIVFVITQIISGESIFRTWSLLKVKRQTSYFRPSGRGALIKTMRR